MLERLITHESRELRQIQGSIPLGDLVVASFPLLPRPFDPEVSQILRLPVHQDWIPVGGRFSKVVHN